MDIYRDVNPYSEENETTADGLVKQQLDSGLQARTPLVDLTNKRAQTSAGVLGSARKQAFNQPNRLDALNLQTSDTPKRQKSSSGSRRSCFAAIHVAEKSDASLEKACSLTLPATVEEEPETGLLENCWLGEVKTSGIHHQSSSTGRYGDRQSVGKMAESGTGSPEPVLENDELLLGCEVTLEAFVDDSECEERTAFSQSYVMSDGISTTDSRQTHFDERNILSDVDSDGQRPSLQSSLVALVEGETDKLVDLVIQELTSELPESFRTSSSESDLENQDAHVLKDHPYVKSYNPNLEGPEYSPPIAVGSPTVSCSSGQESTSPCQISMNKSQVCTSSPSGHANISASKPHINTPHMSTSPVSAISSVERVYSSTPIQVITSTPTPKAYTPTPQVSPSIHLGIQDSPALSQDLANLSASSFKELTQNVELSQLMEAYELYSSSDLSEGPSLSSPSVQRLLNISLVSTAARPQAGQRNTPASSNKNPHLNRDIATIPPSPVICLNFDQIESKNKVLDQAGVQDTPCNEQSVDHITQTELLATRDVQEDMMVIRSNEDRNKMFNLHEHRAEGSDYGLKVGEVVSVTDMSGQPLIVEEEGECQDSVEIQGNSSVLFTPCRSRVNPVSSSIHEASVEHSTAVASPVLSHTQSIDQSSTDQHAESPQLTHLSVTVMTAVPNRSVSTKDSTVISSPIARSGDKSLITETTHMMCKSTNTSGLEHADSSVLTENVEVDKACISTNTSIHVVTDVSVLTDHNAVVNSSMMTDACHALDVSMVTDSVTTQDHSMLAVPDILNKQTMTERKVMQDAESAMTPFKLPKLGKRLTAEEVRRQHPRTIANQLEATMMANQRLEKEAKMSNKERENLKSALKETRNKLSSCQSQQTEERESQEKQISMLQQLHEEAVSGLEICVQEKQKRLYQLEDELREIKSQYEAAEEKLTTLTSEYQPRFDQVDKLRLEAELRYADELQKLRVEFEEQSYYSEFLQSQQIIQQLQAEREEFVALMEDIETATDMQFQLRDALHKLGDKTLHSARKHAFASQELTSQCYSLSKKLAAAEVDLELCKCERQDLAVDVQTMEELLKQSNESLVQLENSYQSLREEVSTSQAQVAQLTYQLSTVTQELAASKTREDLLSQQLCEQQDSETLACQALQETQDRLAQLQQELDTQKQSLLTNQEAQDKMKTEYEAARTKLEQHIENLLYTLDSWEAERDQHDQELKDCQHKLDLQRTRTEEMASELTSLRKVQASSQAEKDLMTELKNTNQFLEAEKQLYLEAITDYRTQLETELELAASNNELIDALRANNRELQQSHEQLAYEVQMLEETLALKNMDMETSWSALDILEEKMGSVLSSLQQKFGIEVKQSPQVKGHSVQRMLDFKAASPQKVSAISSSGQSLVAQVLSKARAFSSDHASCDSVAERDSSVHNSSAGEHRRVRMKQSNVDHRTTTLISPASQSFSVSSSRPHLKDQTSKSASFCHPGELKLDSPTQCTFLQSDRCHGLENLSSPSVLNKSVSGFAKIRSIPSTLDRTIDSLADSRNSDHNVSRKDAVTFSSPEDLSHISDSDSLAAKVRGVTKIFTKIVRAANMVEKTSELTIKDLKGDISLLKDKLKFQNSQCHDLESELASKSSQLSAANSQIKELNTRVTGMTKSILSFQDQQYEISRLEDEKTELNRRVRDLSGECKLLSDQLEEVICKLDSVKSGQRGEGACVREIVALKKRNHELMMRLFDERDKNQELGQKAVRRMRVLEENWEKAEQEVRSFDDLVERIRQTCVTSQAQSTHPVILQVVRLIDGHEDRTGKSQAQAKTPVRHAQASLK